jgi:hypothetical protein
MVKTKTLLASVAATGLLFANPAFASTRSHEALPDAGFELSATDFARSFAPMTGANYLNNEDTEDDATVPLIILGLLVAGGLILILSDDDDDDDDSPG